MWGKVLVLGFFAVCLAGCGQIIESPHSTPSQSATSILPASPTIAPVVSTPTAAAKTIPTSPTTPTPPIAQTLLYIRDNTPDGHIYIVRAGDGRIERILPLGVPNNDWTILYTAALRDNFTDITAYDVAKGIPLWTTTVNGLWRLPEIDANARLGGLSRDGTTLVLTEVLNDAQQKAYMADANPVSHLLILKTDSRATSPRVIALPGHFSYDTISADGLRLFLIEHMPPYTSIHYQVRLYDLQTNALIPDPIVDKGEVEIMEGYPGAQIADGSSTNLYTVYRNTEHGPFIHRLVTNGYAICIDLPSAGKENEAAARLWGLALDGSGNTVYAINPALGLIAESDGARVTRTEHIPVAPATQGRQQPPAHAAVVSGDNRTLYALGDKGVLIIDTRTLKVSRVLAPAVTFDSIALAPSGAQLFATSATQHKILTFDQASGKVLAEIKSVAEPWNILNVETGS